MSDRLYAVAMAAFAVIWIGGSITAANAINEQRKQSKGQVLC